MSTALTATILELAFLLLTLSISLVSSCPCSTTNSLRLRCANSNAQVRHNYLPHDHENRGLYGSCLPETDLNTVVCYKWSTKMCRNEENAEEICKLNRVSVNPILQEGLSQAGGQRSVLYSPGFHRSFNFNRYFCIYNVTLDCPGHKIHLASSERTLPFQDDCQDYLAIYTDKRDFKVCSNKFQHFQGTLNSNHFYAILWTDYETSRGKFELEATCGDTITQAATTEAHEEGSGHNLIDS